MDIVDAIMLSRQFSLRRAGSGNIPARTRDIAFEAVLSKSLQRSPVSAATNTDQINADMKFREGLKFVLEKEGSRFVRQDGGRESSKYGILQSTAAHYGYRGDVRNLSRADAEALYRKVWEKSGSGSLPFPLSTVHFDSYVNNPAAAEKFLVKSQGNIETYLRLREQRYTRLAEVNPERYGKYLKGWKNRVQGLRSMVADYRQSKSFRA
jgi:lysozyme family protein